MDTSSYDYLKYCAARYLVWPRRKQLTPSSRREREKNFPNWYRVVNWEQWWERKFNDNYREYIARIGPL